MRTLTLTPLDGVTATTTSVAIPMDGVVRCTFEFVRADHSSGTSKFEVLGSVDGTNFTATGKGVMIIKEVASASTAFATEALSTTLASATSERWHLPATACYKAIKILNTETTDGTATARVCLQIDDKQ